MFKITVEKLALGVAVVLVLGVVGLVWDWSRPAPKALTQSECVDQALSYLPKPVAQVDVDKVTAVCAEEYPAS